MKLTPEREGWLSDLSNERRTLLISPWQAIRQGLAPLFARAEGTGHTSFLRQLIQNSGIYALASFVLPLVSLVLSPFLTHTLSRADYGALALLTTAITLMTGLTQFGLGSAFFRAYNYDYSETEDKKAVLATLCTLLTISSLLLTLLFLGAAAPISTFLFASPIYSTPIRLAALVVLLQNLAVPGLAWLRAESRAWPYTMLSLLNLLVNLVATLVCVGILQMGVSGALLATAGGYVLIVLWTLPAAFFRVGARLRLAIARNLLAFGLPLVANTISLWVLQLSDRYLLSQLASLSETGSYTVGYTLGGVLGVVVLSPFSLAWPTAMYAIARRSDAPAIFRRIFRWYGLFLLFATAGLALVALGVLLLFFPPAYLVALPVIPLVAISIMFYGLYSYFIIGISLRRKTWLAVVLTTLAALLNVGLNLWLIPRAGSLGAALATLLAYAVLALLGHQVNQRLYPIRFEVGLFLLALGGGILLFALATVVVRWLGLQAGLLILLYLCAFCLYTLFLLGIGRGAEQRERQRQAENFPAQADEASGEKGEDVL